MTFPSASTIVTLVLGLLGSAGLGGLFVKWLEHKRGTRKASDDVALTLVGKLEGRIDKLEADLEKERARCDAELSVHRHRGNNQRTIIYSLLHLFDMPAARRKDALAKVRAELAAMEQAEATEKAIIAAAPLASVEIKG